MQPATNDENITTSDELRDSDNSKSSKYRSMVAQRGSTVWRGNARSKLAAGIDQGTTEHADILAVNLDQDKDAAVESQSGQDLVQQFMDEVDGNEAQQAPDLLSEDLPAPTNDNHEATTGAQPDADPQETQEDQDFPSDEKHGTDQQGKDENPPKKEEQETEIPVIYKNWEPKEEDEETAMEDVELGEQSELEDHIGEVDLDKGAFERLRALEKKERERQRKERMYTGVIAVIILCLLAVLTYVVVELVVQTNKNNDNSNAAATLPTSTSPPLPPPQLRAIPANLQDSYRTAKSEQAAQTAINSVTAYNNGQPINMGEAINQATPDVEPSSQFTGHLTPLQLPEMSHAMNDNQVITIKFPVNMLVPQGSHVMHKVYDGPDCSEGANDITDRDDYAKVGLYSAGAAQRTQNPADRMGLFLQWEQDQVKKSPLYQQIHRSTPAANHQFGDSAFSPSGTMDLCVGIVILNDSGLPDHYMETYILTSWSEDDRLEEVHSIPVTTDSS